MVQALNTAEGSAQFGILGLKKSRCFVKSLKGSSLCTDTNKRDGAFPVE